jgi:hypothetical protein
LLPSARTPRRASQRFPGVESRKAAAEERPREQMAVTTAQRSRVIRPPFLVAPHFGPDLKMYVRNGSSRSCAIPTVADLRRHQSNCKSSPDELARISRGRTNFPGTLCACPSCTSRKKTPSAEHLSRCEFRTEVWMKVAARWGDELVTVALLHAVIDSNKSFHPLHHFAAAHSNDKACC